MKAATFLRSSKAHQAWARWQRMFREGVAVAHTVHTERTALDQVGLTEVAGRLAATYSLGKSQGDLRQNGWRLFAR